MTGIWEFPDLEVLEEFILTALDVGKEITRDEIDEDRQEVLDRISDPVKIVVVDEWGNGEAEIGEDQLRVLVFYGMEGTDPATNPQFDPAVRTIRSNTINAINRGEIGIPDDVREWFDGLDITPNPITRVEGAINLTIGTGEGNTVFDLTEAEAIQYSEDVSFEQLPRIPLESLLEDVEEDEEEQAEEVEEIPEEEPEEELTEEEQLEQEFPEIPPQLRVYATSSDTLEVPNGTKDTKTVEPRDPYGFEIVMATDRVNPRNIPFSADPEIQVDVMPGVGDAIRAGNFGDALIDENQTAPGSFPRTGAYIRNHLKFREPSYALEMHKDFLIYTAFVNGIYEYRLTAGRYDSFREYIYVLKEIGKSGGPVLIEPMSQQMAASEGLETIPDHPTIEGEKAPWLENRQYYTLVEENEDHEAWSDPYGFLHEDLADQ